MCLAYICVDCASNFGADQQYLTELPWHQEIAVHCDNCAKIRMLKPITDYHLSISPVWFDGLKAARVNHRAYLYKDSVKGFDIVLTGPQIRTLEEARNYQEQQKRINNAANAYIRDKSMKIYQ